MNIYVKGETGMDFRGELSRMLQNETGYVFDVDLLEYSKKMLASRSEIPRLYRYERICG